MHAGRVALVGGFAIAAAMLGDPAHSYRAYKTTVAPIISDANVAKALECKPDEMRRIERTWFRCPPTLKTGRMPS
jgi:hypothetical protein